MSATPTLPASGPPTPAVVPHIPTPPRPWATVPRSTGDPSSAGVTDAPAQSRRAARYGEPVAPVLRGGLVVMALVGTLAAQVWLFWVMLERRGLLVDVRDGVPISADELLAGDDRVLRAVLVSLVPISVLVVSLMAWMFRAYKNVGAWQPIEYGVGWAIFGWIVPFMNLLRPGKIMVEIVEGSRTGGRSGGLVWWWWIAWLVPWVGTRGIGLMGDDIDALLLAETLQLGLIAVSMVAAVLLMVIVARATSDQRQRIRRSAGAGDDLLTD